MNRTQKPTCCLAMECKSVADFVEPECHCRETSSVLIWFCKVLRFARCFSHLFSGAAFFQKGNSQSSLPIGCTYHFQHAVLQASHKSEDRTKIRRRPQCCVSRSNFCRIGQNSVGEPKAFESLLRCCNRFVFG